MEMAEPIPLGGKCDKAEPHCAISIYFRPCLMTGLTVVIIYVHLMPKT